MKKKVAKLFGRIFLPLPDNELFGSAKLMDTAKLFGDVYENGCPGSEAFPSAKRVVVNIVSRYPLLADATKCSAFFTQTNSRNRYSWSGRRNGAFPEYVWGY
jgi:hypothetical protein